MTLTVRMSSVPHRKKVLGGFFVFFFHPREDNGRSDDRILIKNSSHCLNSEFTLDSPMNPSKDNNFCSYSLLF